MDDTTRFLDTLFADLPEGWHFALTRRRGWHTRFFTNTKAALTIAANWSKTDDVYVCVGLHRVARIDGSRGEADQVDGLAGLWIDLDLANEGHKRPGLFETMDEAQDFLNSLPLAPTITVSSGGGIQAHFGFREPWLFETDAEREKAKALAAGWVDFCRSEAQKIGRSVDATKSLAQILRLPGTINHKYESKPTVTIEALDDACRYNPSDFEPYTQGFTPHVTTGGAGAIQGKTLVLNPQAVPPFKKFEALRANDSTFQPTWDHARKDGVRKNWSASEWDIALTNMLVRAKWSEQEIVDTLIAGRAYHKQDLKLREDYYRRTINKVTSGINTEEAYERLDELIDQEAQLKIDPELRAGALKYVSQCLDFEVIEVRKYMSEVKQYSLVTKQWGEIMLGGIANITYYEKFMLHVADTTKKIIPPHKSDKWRPIAQAMLHASTDYDTGSESTDCGLMESRMQMYFESHKPQAPKTNEQEAQILREHQPIIKQGATHVYVEDFRQWINTTFHDGYKGQDIYVILKRAKCAQKTLGIPATKRHTSSSISYWSLPNMWARYGAPIPVGAGAEPTGQDAEDDDSFGYGANVNGHEEQGQA